jgi:peptide/nickel transport system substrate-binding protein
MATRGEYQIGANLTGVGIDDPDANYYENFACGSPRNYTFYCNEQIGAMFDKQSAEIDAKKRLALVWEIQKKLEEEAARPTLTWRVDNFTHWPQVKNLIPHNNFYNYGRMQEVWLDR